MIVAPDDSYVRVTYIDDAPAGRTRSATTRITCRDLRFTSAGYFVADPTAPCRPDPTGSVALRPGSSGYLDVTFTSDGGAVATGLTATVHPQLAFVSTAAGAISLADAPPDSTASFPISVHPDACRDSPTSLRFRVEIQGDFGFRDRSYFDVPLDCSVAGTATLDLARPEEVPDTLGGPSAPSVRMQKAGTLTEHLVMAWDGVASADEYLIWRGTIEALVDGEYDHAILDDNQASEMCNLPGGLGTLNKTLLFEVEDHPGSHYYLVSSRSDCAGAFEISGTTGTSRHGSQPLADRPDGRIEAPQCQ